MLEDIKELLYKPAQGQLKKYLKSLEIMDLLKISPGTLQNIRVNGILPYTKVVGTYCYDSEEIHKVMDANCAR